MNFNHVVPISCDVFQRELCAATQGLSMQLKAYETQVGDQRLLVILNVWVLGF